MDSIKEEPVNLDSDEAVAEGLLSDETEVEDVTTLAEEVEEKEEGEELLTEETGEVKPPAPIEEHEITDDSARMYLQEIGRVPLLNVSQEKLLCRKIELGRSLDAIEENHFGKYKRFPSPAEIVVQLISRLPKAYPIARIIDKHVGIVSSKNVVETIKNPRFRSAIDDVIDTSLIAATAKGIGKGTTAAEDAIVDLSVNTQLLPPQLLALLSKGKTSWQKLKALLTDDRFMSRLDSQSSDFKAYFIEQRQGAVIKKK